jgi:biotin carboxyl carrier protein
MESADKNIYKTLVIEGESYKTLLTDKFEKRKKWEKVNPKIITSFMPGTILKVSVSQGQKVKAGDEMFIIDSMKMKNHVTVPFDGIIKATFVSDGQQIPKGFPILEFE